MARLALAAVLAMAAGNASGQSPAPPAAPDRARVLAAAREIMQKARYCTLVTVGRDGHPQARVVDTFPPEDELTVWMATNPLTRKVAEIEKDPRVTLSCFEPASQGYVTVLGRADLVRDGAEKARRWKKEWAGFYKHENRGDDYLLVRLRPLRLEIVSDGHGLGTDPRTWRPVSVEWPR